MPPGTRPLLEQVMAGGRRTGPPRPLTEARAAFEADLAELPAPARRLADPLSPQAVTSERLRWLTADVRRRIEERLRSVEAAAPGTRAG